MAEGDFPRHLVTTLDEALKAARIVNLTGPRQVGKTTMVRELFEKGSYVTLDDDAVLAAIEADPLGQLASLAADASDGGPVIIDEAQRSKKLAIAMKALVDKNRRKGQFVLTGSSNIFTTMDVADSLAGRMLVLKLWPLMVSEVRHIGPNRILDWALQDDPSLDQIVTPESLSRDAYIDLVLEGGFPEPRDLSLRARQTLYRNYVDAVVDRDVADLLRIRKTDRLRMLIEQMASRTAQEINVSELSGLLGIKRETIDTYLDVLTRLSLIIKLGAWTSGEARREIRQPKYHFVDTGMNCALRGLTDQAFDIRRPTVSLLGGLLESFVFNEIVRSLPDQDTDIRLYHWRNSDGREIDIIADAGSHLIGIEVKSAASVDASDFKHLQWFASKGPGKNREFTGVVFYMGETKLSFGDRCFALPVSTLWSQIDLEG